MKTKQVLKAILFGLLAGAAIFFIPFPFRFFFGFLLIFFAFRFFAFGRRYRGGWRTGYAPYQFMHNHVYAKRWRNMSDDERKAFIKKMENELFADKTATE